MAKTLLFSMAVGRSVVPVSVVPLTANSEISFRNLTRYHCAERLKKSIPYCTFLRFLFLARFLPPKEKIPSLTNEPD
jgi:hypothetical protein